jgi:hypothetical protein
MPDAMGVAGAGRPRQCPRTAIIMSTARQIPKTIQAESRRRAPSPISRSPSIHIGFARHWTAQGQTDEHSDSTNTANDDHEEIASESTMQ